MQTISKRQTSITKRQWGPAWLHDKPNARQADRKPEATSKPTAARPPDDVFEASEFYWSQLPPRDYAYLTGARGYPSPCVWCSGRLMHSPECDDLQRSWELEMPFGKHKGKRISEVPLDYLYWLLMKPGLEGGLRAAIEQRLCRSVS